MNMTETDNRNTITQAIADLNTLLNKHDNSANMAMRPLIQHFGRVCQVVDVALVELGWKNVRDMTLPVLMQHDGRTNEQAHEYLDKRIAGCMSVLVRNMGDPMTIEFGILSTLSYSFKEQLLKEMREALL